LSPFKFLVRRKMRLTEEQVRKARFVPASDEKIEKAKKAKTALQGFPPASAGTLALQDAVNKLEDSTKPKSNLQLNIFYTKNTFKFKKNDFTNLELRHVFSQFKKLLDGSQPDDSDRTEYKVAKEKTLILTYNLFNKRIEVEHCEFSFIELMAIYEYFSPAFEINKPHA